MNVTLQDIANLGEIAGAIATICTLLYLAIQIRDNTRAMRAEARLRFLRTPGGRDFWEQQRKSYDPAFEACVDEWLSTQNDGVELRPLASSSGRKGEPERASS